MPHHAMNTYFSISIRRNKADLSDKGQGEEGQNSTWTALGITFKYINSPILNGVTQSGKSALMGLSGTCFKVVFRTATVILPNFREDPFATSN